MPRPKNASARKGGVSKLTQEFPGVSHYRDRHGKLRWRYRKDGLVVNLGTVYGSPEFLRRYTAAVAGIRLSSAGEATGGVSQAPHGSLSSVIESWYQSPDFKRYAPLTVRGHRSIAEKLREEHGDKLVEKMSLSDVKALMAQKADTPAAANNLLKTLRPILDHAQHDMHLIDFNPAREAKKYHTVNPDGFHTWTEAEIKKYQDKWEVGTTADLAMALMLYTGAARVDVVQLGPENIKDGRLQYRRQKTRNQSGVLVDIPIHPELQRRLDLIPPEVGTFLQTVHGEQRSSNGFGNAMRAWCDKAGLPECSSHGLRKAVSRRLAEAGATPHEIMSITGHKTLAEVERYTSKVTRAGLADRALDRLAGDTGK
jgi:integrase